MKLFSLVIALNLFLNASIYFAKLEPIETYNVKAAVSGKVVFINESIKSKIAMNSTIVKLDSKVDSVDLQQTKRKLNTLTQIINIEKSTLEKFLNIRSKSQLDKDNQKIKVLNLESQQSDLIIKIANLKDKISNKNLKEKDVYISNINVQVSDFVNAGSLLYTAMDLSKGKLEIFLPFVELENILNKTIYLDGRITDYKIYKLYKTADTKHISSYKCEIIINSPKKFSNLIKIEFK